MAAARSFAAFLLLGFATTLRAQSLVITVLDQSGAAIPSARIVIVTTPDAGLNEKGSQSPVQQVAESDAAGQATVHLAQASYNISVSSPGFLRNLQRVEIHDGQVHTIRAILNIDNYGCGICVTSEITSPVESAPSLNFFIPFEPLRLIRVPNARLRRRR